MTDLLRVTAVTRGWNGYRNKSQHRKSTLEKKILPPLQQGFEPTTFQSRVRRSNHWAIPAPQHNSSRLRVCEPFWQKDLDWYCFGSSFSSKRLWTVDIVLWLCHSQKLLIKHWKWLSSLPIVVMQELFWWWQCSDRYIIPSLFPYLCITFPHSPRP